LTPIIKGGSFMLAQSKAVASIEAIHSQLANCLRGIAVGRARDDANASELAEATHLLEALPLSTGEFAVASNRLSNARRYLDAGERGAAHYEVQLLMRGMVHAG
jgi:hypothetical protein